MSVKLSDAIDSTVAFVPSLITFSSYLFNINFNICLLLVIEENFIIENMRQTKVNVVGKQSQQQLHC